MAQLSFAYPDGYTAAMASEYKEVCQRYARRETEAQKPAAAPTASGAVKEGASQLRKLFGR